MQINYIYMKLRGLGHHNFRQRYEQLKIYSFFCLVGILYHRMGSYLRSFSIVTVHKWTLSRFCIHLRSNHCRPYTKSRNEVSLGLLRKHHITIRAENVADCEAKPQVHPKRIVFKSKCLFAWKYFGIVYKKKTIIEYYCIE